MNKLLIIIFIVLVCLYLFSQFLEFCKWMCTKADEHKERINKQHERQSISNNPNRDSDGRNYMFMYSTK